MPVELLVSESDIELEEEESSDEEEVEEFTQVSIYKGVGEVWRDSHQ